MRGKKNEIPLKKKCDACKIEVFFKNYQELKKNK